MWMPKDEAWNLPFSHIIHWGSISQPIPKLLYMGFFCGQLAPRIPCFILRIVAGGQLVSSGISMSTSLACNKHCNH